MSKKKVFSRLIVRVVRWINIAVAAIYLLSAYVGFLHPGHCGYANLLGIAYPIFLLLLLLFIPFWLAARRSHTLISLVALCMTIPQAWACCPLNIPQKSGTPAFRIMTYNTFGMVNPDLDGPAHPVYDEILKYDADFVCMQEASLGWKAQPVNEQMDSMRRRYHYWEINKKTSLGYYSKKPVETILRETDSIYFYTEVYKTVIDTTTTFIVNMHLESIGLTKTDKELYMELISVKDKEKTLRGIRSQLMNKLVAAFKNRAGQAERVRAIADSIASANPEANILLCGDFNDTPYSYAYRTVRGNYRDAYSDGAFGPNYTYNANRFYFRIDHLFYKGNIEAVHTWRGKSKASDHYPLISDFKIKP